MYMQLGYANDSVDKAESFSDPLLSGVRAGANTNTNSSPFFDSDYYLTRNPDVAASGVDPWRHYVDQGFSEGRLPKNDFSIEIEYVAGSESFTPQMKTAIDDAAETWENAISRSNFRGGHTLTIEVGGENLGVNGFEAVAAPIKETLVADSNSKLLPIEGFSTINTSPSKMRRFSTNTEYFTDVMAHEFGHVMGIGTLWAENNLIDPLSGVYYGNTNAGKVYSSTGQDIPLTTEEGRGSDLLHWREEVFDNELLTHMLEAPGESNPLSALTLGSLSDIGWNVFDDAADIYPNFSTEGIFA